jgi:hypothetical protein
LRRTKVVGGAGPGGERNSATDVVRVAMSIDHGLDREARFASQVQIMMEMPEGIDHDGLPGAGHHIAQAASRGPAHLVDGQIGTFD